MDDKTFKSGKKIFRKKSSEEKYFLFCVCYQKSPPKMVCSAFLSFFFIYYLRLLVFSYAHKFMRAKHFMVEHHFIKHRNNHHKNSLNIFSTYESILYTIFIWIYSNCENVLNKIITATRTIIRIHYRYDSILNEEAFWC